MSLETLESTLEGFVPGIPNERLVPLLSQLRDHLRRDTAKVGIASTLTMCDKFLQSELIASSLNSLLVGYLSRGSDLVVELCSDCLSLLTPDSVACGIRAGKSIRVEVVPGEVVLDLELGDFYEEWTGCRVWPGAIHLSNALLSGEYPVKGCDVLELGSGIGLTGICALKAGASHVAFSEYKQSLLETCFTNADHNQANEPRSSNTGFLLDWNGFNANEHVDFSNWVIKRKGDWIVIGSELIYEEVHAVMVVEVLYQMFLAGASRGVISVMTRPSRTGVAEFLEIMHSLPAEFPFQAEIRIKDSDTESAAFIHLTRNS